MTVEPAEVKALRDRYGWSRKEMAALFGVTAQTIKGWELGTRTCLGTSAVLITLALESDDAVKLLRDHAATFRQ